jgi:hypothetical protein
VSRERERDRDAFERAKKANMFGNELDHEIHSLHHYLKHYIISRGSKVDVLPSAASTAPAEKVTFTEYQVTLSSLPFSSRFTFSSQPYQTSRKAFPGCCTHKPASTANATHTTPTTPKTYVTSPPRSHAGADPASSSLPRNEEDEHSEDAATTIFCIDTINDIGMEALTIRSIYELPSPLRGVCNASGSVDCGGTYRLPRCQIAHCRFFVGRLSVEDNLGKVYGQKVFAQQVIV